MESEQKDIKNELHSVNTKIASFESEKSGIQSEMRDLKRRLISLEKFSRSRNVELQMLPEKPNENLAAIVKKICQIIKAPISDGDICAVHRTAKIDPSTQRPRNVLITLPSERHRDHLLSSYKRFNKSLKSDHLNTSYLDIAGEKHNIYMVEHLAPECKSLHAADRRVAKERQYNYVWIKFGRVYVRKNESSPAIVIKDLACLDKLV